MGKKCKRCPVDNCNEKIPPAAALIGLCKCGLCFCIAHRLPESHNCTFKKSEEAILSEEKNKKKLADELRCVPNKF
tara:strand:- start:1368 stop:1595 length:228 start_codon:yes stop_codon:yes gene_type:complete